MFYQTRGLVEQEEEEEEEEEQVPHPPPATPTAGHSQLQSLRPAL